MQSLGVQQAPKTVAREQSGTAERPSFRSSMERAEQQAAKPAGEQPAEEAGQPGLQEGLNQAVEEAAVEEAAQIVDAIPEEGKGVMDELLSALMAEGETGLEEDAPAQDALEIGELAAAVVQQAVEAQPQAEAVEQVMVEAVVQEGQAKGQNIAWQAVVPQEGEQQDVSRMEAAGQAVQTNFENTLAEAARPVDMTAREQDSQPQEQNNMQELPVQFAAAFGVGQQQAVTVADLTAPNGEPLPGPEMGQALQDSIFEQIQSAVSTGKQELFIQLKPESLGGLVIQLSMTEEGIKAQVRTGSENIQHIVNAQIVQLEEALRARDIPIVQMEVIYDQSASNSFLNQQRQSWQEQGGGQRAVMMAIEDTAGLYESALAPDDVAEGLGEGVVYSA